MKLPPPPVVDAANLPTVTRYPQASPSPPRCFANKGALLVEGEFDGQKFQLLGTHIQAGGPDSIKQKQYEAIRVLTDQYKEEGVPQILVGDFNKGKDNGDSYYKMLSTLDVKDYEPDSEMKFTAGSDNDFRLGGDDRLIDFIFYRPNGLEPKKMIRNVRRFRSEYRNLVSSKVTYGVIDKIISKKNIFQKQ